MALAHTSLHAWLGLRLLLATAEAPATSAAASADVALLAETAGMTAKDPSVPLAAVVSGAVDLAGAAGAEDGHVVLPALMKASMAVRCTCTQNRC